MENSKPTKHRLPMSHPRYEDIVYPRQENINKADGIPFRSVLEEPTYVPTITRPDISTAVRTVARFKLIPTLLHWEMVKHVN